MKTKDRRIAFLTYYLMIGGLIGLLVSFIGLRKPQPDFWFWFSFSVSGLLFLACFYSGYLFLNKDPKRAAEWGIFVHLFQLLSFTSGGWSYYFAAGFGLSLDYAVDSQRFGITASISEFEWLLVPKTSPKEWGFNIVAIFILIILIRIRKQYKRRRESK